MDQSELMQLVLGRADALNGYWNLYIAVAVGLIGLVAAARDVLKSGWIRFLLTLGFVVFVLANLQVMHATNEQRFRLLKLMDASHASLAEPSAPPSWITLLLFHLFLDVIMVVLLWWIPKDSDSGLPIRSRGA